MLYALDAALAEQSVGLDHQHNDQDDEGDDLLRAAADVAAGVRLEEADDRAADDRARDGVEAAENDDRKTCNPMRPTSVLTPTMLATRMPATAAVTAAMAQATAKMRWMLMPMLIAACWSSATARMAMPSLVRRKKRMKPSRNRPHSATA